MQKIKLLKLARNLSLQFIIKIVIGQISIIINIINIINYYYYYIYADIHAELLILRLLLNDKQQQIAAGNSAGRSSISLIGVR